MPQPLKEIGALCRENKTFFHSDNAQMLGKVCAQQDTRTRAVLPPMPAHTRAPHAVAPHTNRHQLPIDVNEFNLDVMSMSSHKVYGPKGMGALYVRRRPRVRMEPQMSGGGQERGLRSGTLPAPLVVVRTRCRSRRRSPPTPRPCSPHVV